MAQTVSTFDAALKEHYVGLELVDMTDVAGGVVYATIKRNTKAGGKAGKIIHALKLQRAGGGSSTFAKAKANAVPTKYEDITLPRRKNYQFAYIENEVIEASMGDENAFARALDDIDDAFKNCVIRQARMFPRSGGGALGRIAAGTTLTAKVLTLDDPADAMNFEVEGLYTFAAANGTGSERDSSATNECAGISRETAEITFVDDLDDVSGIQDTDYIFQEGDFGLWHLGVEDWIPIDRTGLATPFNGMTRSVDADKLAGLIRIANGEGLDETLLKAMGTHGKYKGVATHAVMNPEVESDLMLELEGKVQMNRTEIKGQGTVGFSAIEVINGSNKSMIISDMTWPTKRMLITDLSSWVRHSAGESPKFLDRDGLLSRDSDDDAWEVRIGGYGNNGNEAPLFSINCDLS